MALDADAGSVTGFPAEVMVFAVRMERLPLSLDA
jgi:hypothetical protein